MINRLAIDTETTGLDPFHGCRPFIVSAASFTGKLYWWEWSVNPYTRVPHIPKEDIREIRELLGKSDEYYFHNSKFDIRMLEAIGINWTEDYWENTYDTTLMSHAVNNHWDKKLKTLAANLFGISDQDEKDLQEAVKKARAIGRTRGYRVAKAGDPHFPAHKGNGEKKFSFADYWLPREILDCCPDCHGRRKCAFCKEHKDWGSLAVKYGKRDPERTVLLADAFMIELKREGLWEQFTSRNELVKINYEMQTTGISLRKDEIKPIVKKYRGRVKKYRQRAHKTTRKFNAPIQNITSDVDRGLILHGFSHREKQDDGKFKYFKGDNCGFNIPLPPQNKTKTNQPSCTAEIFESYLNEAERRHYEAPNERVAKQYKDQITFLKNITISDKISKLTDFVESYSKWMVIGPNGVAYLHPNANIGGTRFTRCSYSDPNLQQVPKVKSDSGLPFNPRSCFGPEQDYIWYDMDYSNLELRIWAYACGNKELIHCFENDISVHLLIARELFPRLRKMSDQAVKDTQEYGWTKNGNFSLIYGAGKKRSDNTYHVVGAADKIAKRFPEIPEFTRRMANYVKKQGYITTMGGYRLHIPLSEPHKAVSGFVQGTAGDIMKNAMLNCYEAFKEINKGKEEHEFSSMMIQIHDQLMFRIHKSAHSIQTCNILQAAMEKGGTQVSLHTPIDPDVIPVQWDKAISASKFDWSLAV